MCHTNKVKHSGWMHAHAAGFTMCMCAYVYVCTCVCVCVFCVCAVLVRDDQHGVISIEMQTDTFNKTNAFGVCERVLSVAYFLHQSRCPLRSFS